MVFGDSFFVLVFVCVIVMISDFLRHNGIVPTCVDLYHVQWVSSRISYPASIAIHWWKWICMYIACLLVNWIVFTSIREISTSRSLFRIKKKTEKNKALSHLHPALYEVCSRYFNLHEKSSEINVYRSRYSLVPATICVYRYERWTITEHFVCTYIVFISEWVCSWNCLEANWVQFSSPDMM